MKALKEIKSKLGLITLIAAAVLTVGCGSSKSGDGAKGNNPGGGSGVPPVTDPDTIVTPTGGIVVDMINVNIDALGDYTQNTSIPFRSPSDFKLRLNIQKFGTYTKTGGGFDYGFGGYVSVSFKTSVNGSTQNYQDTFSSMVNSSGVVRTNAANHKYNLLSTDYPELDGRIGYHGFFEDLYGAVIVVVDSTNDLGDGQGPTSANGSVWFKNHGLSYAPKSPTSCWFVSTGPYDCRTWKSGDKVQTKRSIYPDSGYTKLADFVDLDMTKAFNL